MLHADPGTARGPWQLPYTGRGTAWGMQCHYVRHLATSERVFTAISRRLSVCFPAMQPTSQLSFCDLIKSRCYKLTLLRYLAPGRGANYCDECVCLSVCPLAYLKNNTSRNFLCMLPVAVARSSSDDNAIRYVLPVMWMTSCFQAEATGRG